MRINLRGGGDIASNPARELARKRTDAAYEADLEAERDNLRRILSWGVHGAGTPDSRPGSTRGGTNEENPLEQIKTPQRGF